MIVDDEAKAREMLLFLLENYIPEIEEIRMADGADEADRILSRFLPTLVFLDIKMPGRDGFTWLREIKERPFSVIFTTAHDQFAIRAIRFAAFDYILKPVDAQDLRNAFDRFISEQDTIPQYANLFHNAEQKEDKDYRLTISTVEGTHYLKPTQIIRCEGDGNYTFFYTEIGKKIVASKPVGVYEELLEPMGFIRCHKSHLINPTFVVKYSDDGLTLANDTTVEISRRRRKRVKDKLQKYLGRRHE